MNENLNELEIITNNISLKLKLLKFFSASKTNKTMKNLFVLLALFICIHSDTKAQSYTSIFGDKETSWTLGWELFDNYQVFGLKTNGDTSIHNHQYKKIAYQELRQIFGFLREDTIAGKAWFLYHADTSEYLVMDLNLAVGDSFKMNVEGGMPDFYLIVDSVFFINNKKHIRFKSKIKFANRQENFTFIEGVSTNAGFTFQVPRLSPALYSHTLFCSYKDSVQVFKNKIFNGDCFPILGGIQKPKTNTIDWKLTPNPFSNTAELTFDNTRFKECSLIILDQYGRQVDFYENIISGYVILSKKHFLTGIYYFQLISNNTVIASGKILID